MMRYLYTTVIKTALDPLTEHSLGTLLNTFTPQIAALTYKPLVVVITTG